MRNIKICVPVTGKTVPEFLINLQKAQHVSEMVELRVDYIENLNISGLDKIKTAVTKEVIFTCRSKAEGGFFNQSEEERIRLYSKAFELGFDYYDIELSAVGNFKISDELKSKIIFSYHNFELTPDLEQLRELVKAMVKEKVGVIKIATKVTSDEDNVNLLRILLEKEKNQNLIVIGMGELGRITRIIGPMLGSYLTFASLDDMATAVGQISYHKMKKIFDLID